MVKFKKTELNKTAFEQKVAAGTVKNDDITFLSNEKKIWSDGVYYDCNSDAVQTNLNTHTSNKSNPHSVTKAQVGLGNVNNTSDANKPVSTAQATAIADAKKAGTDAQTNLNTHTTNKSNPHGVTKAQVGLGDVTNESKTTMFTNPTFTGTPKAPTAATSTNTTQIATTAFVQSAIDNKLAANDAMLFKGTIGTNGTITALPDTHNAGWTYKVITAGTYAGIKCEVGDMIICITDGTAANNAHWTVVQTNIDGAVTGPAASTTNHIATFNGTTGKVIKDSGYTIATSVPSGAKFTDTTYSAGTGMSLSGTTFNHSNSITAGTASGDAAKTLAWGGTFTIPSVTYDAQGHITAKGSTTMTMPGNPNNHYTTALKVGKSATDTANAAATNGNVYLNLMDNTTIRDSHKIVGSGATTVTSDANGNITIKSTDSNTDTKNTAGSTDSSSKLFIIGAASQAANPQTYSHDTAYIGTDGCLYSGGSKVLTSHQSLANYVTLDGIQTITGQKTFNSPILHKSTGTWLDGMKNGSVINFPTVGYDSLVHWKTKNGHVSISCHASNGETITFGYMTDSQVNDGTNSLNKTILINPSSGSIEADLFSGIASSALKLTDPKGSTTQPVYFDSNGYAQKCTYTLGKSVPSNAVFTDTVYTHPTTAGNKHIPAGGSAGQILRWSADGTAVWGADNNTTYGLVSTSANGLMPKLPTANIGGDITPQLQLLNGKGQYVGPSLSYSYLNDTLTFGLGTSTMGLGGVTTTIPTATTTYNGLMSKTDKAKLDSVNMVGSRVAIEEQEFTEDSNALPIYFSDQEFPDGGDILGYTRNFTYDPFSSELSGSKYATSKRWTITPNSVKFSIPSDNTSYGLGGINSSRTLCIESSGLNIVNTKGSVEINTENGIINTTRGEMFFNAPSIIISKEGVLTEVPNINITNDTTASPKISINNYDNININTYIDTSSTSSGNVTKNSTMTIGAIVATQGSVKSNLVKLVLSGTMQITQGIGAPVCKLGSTIQSYDCSFYNGLFTGTLTCASLTQTSDIRKKNVSDNINLSLDSIAEAPQFIYKLKDVENDKDHVGTSAQYWEEKYPGLFTQLNEDGFYGLEISNLALSSAISIAKEFKKYKEQTEKTIKELQEQVKTLINVVSELS